MKWKWTIITKKGCHFAYQTLLAKFALGVGCEVFTRNNLKPSCEIESGVLGLNLNVWEVEGLIVFGWAFEQVEFGFEWNNWEIKVFWLWRMEKEKKMRNYEYQGSKHLDYNS